MKGALSKRNFMEEIMGVLSFVVFIMQLAVMMKILG